MPIFLKWIFSERKLGARLTLSAVLLAIIFAVLMLSTGASRRPPGAQLYRQILSNHLLNNEVFGKVNFALNTFTARTRYEGRVRINLPPKPGYYTIVLFKFDPSLPAYAKNQCLSYPKEEITFCDARFLDAFPDPAPIQLRESDLPAPSFLLLWAIGHEVGHVVLRHRRPGLLELPWSFSPRLWKSPSDELVNLRSLADMVTLGNSQENDADAFAINQLRLNPTRATQMSLTITDAALWLQHRARTSAQKGQSPILSISRHSHPPLLMRVLALSKKMNELFVDYVQLPYIDDDRLSFQVRKVGQLVIDQSSLIYDGVYRHILEKKMTESEVYDLALHALFMYGSGDFKLMHDAYCLTKAQNNGNEFCTNQLPIGNHDNGNGKCPQSEEVELVKCVRGRVRHYLKCFEPHSVPNRNNQDCALPLLISNVEEPLEQLTGIKFSNESKKWLALAHAEIFLRRTLESSEGRVDFDEYVSYLADKWGRALALRFVERFAVEHRKVHPDAIETNASAHLMARDLAKDLGAREVALHHAAATVQLADKLDGEKYDLARAAARSELGRLYLAAQHQVPRLRLEQYKAEHVTKALPLFSESVAIRRRTLVNAERAENAEVISMAAEQLSVAVNDVLFSLIQVGECDAGLKFADTADSLVSRLESNPRGQATSLENVAAANVCALGGNADAAISAASRAVEIRRRFDKSSRDIRRLSIAYFTLWSSAQKKGDTVRCREAAKNFVLTYQAATGQRPAVLGTIIGGKLVTMAECLTTNVGDQDESSN